MPLHSLQKFTCQELDNLMSNVAYATTIKYYNQVLSTFYFVIVTEKCQQDINSLSTAEATFHLVPQHSNSTLHTAPHQCSSVHNLITVLQQENTVTTKYLLTLKKCHCCQTVLNCCTCPALDAFWTHNIHCLHFLLLILSVHVIHLHGCRKIIYHLFSVVSAKKNC